MRIEFIPIGALLLAGTSLAQTPVDVNVRIVDQGGTDLASYPTGYAKITIGGSTVDSGNVASVLPGTHNVRLHLVSGNLIRDLTGVEITATTTDLDFEWITEPVVVTVRDQAGAPLTGHVSIGIAQVGGVSNGGAITLPITDNSVYPGLGGYWGNGFQFTPVLFGNLCRDLTGIEITQATDALDIEWITETVTLTMSDQAGDPIPTGWQPFISVGNVGTVAPGGSLALPITDNTVYPDIRPSCAFASGYGMTLILFGNLCRNFKGPNAVEISPATGALDFEWITETVTVSLSDQNGAPLPAAWNPNISIAGASGVSTAGGTATLPITDNSVYPEILPSCAFADGYRVSLTLFSGNLAYDVSGLEIGTTTDALAFEWITVSGPLEVIDASGATLPGSTWNFTGGVGTGNSGDPLILPITDNSVYPTLRLNWANGLHAIVDPITTPGSGNFQFEVLPNADLLPQFFSIDGQDFGLRFRLNESPAADAGDNLTILSSEQASTMVAGSGSDPDGDAMTYRWLESGSEIQAGTVDPAGAALLDIFSLGGLSLGSHTFVLEVSDGQEISTDSMILIVDNSPPEVAVGGSIIAEVGGDITLVGEVADYDGDTIGYSWAEGATVVTSGSLATIASGDSVDLPPHVIGGGLSLGVHVLSLAVDDGINAPASAQVSVNVVDTMVPTMAPVADTALLWPPNHQMVTVTVDLNASDNSGGVLSYSAMVSSTENPDKDGDGNTIPDWTQPTFDVAAGTMTVLLRAERSGKGTGRVYSAIITATDGSGNSSESTIEVVCPHDRRKK